MQAILQLLWDAGELYLGKYGGQYCFGCERFYTEKEIVDGKCPDHQTPLTYIEEENYFFKMSAVSGVAGGLPRGNPDLIRPERYRNEILGFLRDPLQDLSISRPTSRLQWGIPLPFDDNYVTYVWFDALINYVSALGWPDGERFRTFWPHVQHLIGKDILKPHAVYWPCMLKAIAEVRPADELIFRHLNVHGYWNISGGKISKSVGNLVEALALSEKYGNDAFRYFVLREMVFGLDADFSEEAFVGRLNADLANDLGNLVARATTLIVSSAAGSPAAGPDGAQERDPGSASAGDAHGEARAAMEQFAFQRALGSDLEFIGRGQRLHRHRPSRGRWPRTGPRRRGARLEVVLYTLGESLRFLGIVLDPFIPEAAAKIRAAVGRPASRAWPTRRGAARSADAVQKLSGLFPRVDQARRDAARGRRKAPAADGPNSAGRPRKTEFAKLDLRVAEIVAAEAVPKSKKLLKVTVSLGGEQRTVVAGIAEHYGPEDLVGKKVVIVANLEPARLMGIESQGMLLAGSAEGRLSVLTLDRDLPPGAKVS